MEKESLKIKELEQATAAKEGKEQNLAVKNAGTTAVRKPYFALVYL